jgi:hypothetical protein
MQLTSDFMGLSASSISSAHRKNQETGMLTIPSERRKKEKKNVLGKCNEFAK